MKTESILIASIPIWIIIAGTTDAFVNKISFLPLKHKFTPHCSRSVGDSLIRMSGHALSNNNVGITQVNVGPHMRIGKKGAILNPWGFWVMFYSVFIALFGYAYLKMRILLGAMTLGLLKPKPEHCCWIMHAWCKLVLWLGLSNPEVKGLENLPPKGETILVAANHMSWFDVPVLSGYLGERQLWSFAKAELVKVPILGTYMKSAEHILVSRDSRKSQLESLKSAINTIKQDRDIFIFPEGTRSLDGKLRSFKGGAFTIARKTGVKIVPVTLLGNNIVFPANALMPVCPGRGLMKMIVHPSIDPEGKTDEELLDLTRKAIASVLPAGQIMEQSTEPFVTTSPDARLQASSP